MAPRPPAPVRGQHRGEARAVAEHHVGGRGDGGGVVGEAEAGVGAVEAPGGGGGHVLDQQPGQEHRHQARPVQHQLPRHPLQSGLSCHVSTQCRLKLSRLSLPFHFIDVDKLLLGQLFDL